MKLKLTRTHKFDTETLGELFVDEEFFGYTLEDPHKDRKVYGNTCIPVGAYKVQVTYSPKFKKLLPLVWNVDKDRSVLDSDGDRWTGIRFHGGNTHKDTYGCILVAQNQHICDPGVFEGIENWIQGSLSDELVELLGSKVHDLIIE